MTSTNNVKSLSRIRHYHWASLLDIEDAVVSGIPISLRTAESQTLMIKGLRFFSSAEYRHRMF
jgi:hypothetical protein